MNTWHNKLAIIKYHTTPKDAKFPVTPYGDNGVYRLWAVIGMEPFYCKILEEYVIEQLSNNRYLTLSQRNNLDKLMEGRYVNASA